MSLLVAIDVATKSYVFEGKVRLELEVALDELAEFFAVFVAHVNKLDPLLHSGYSRMRK